MLHTTVAVIVLVHIIIFELTHCTCSANKQIFDRISQRVRFCVTRAMHPQTLLDFIFMHTTIGQVKKMNNFSFRRIITVFHEGVVQIVVVLVKEK